MGLTYRRTLSTTPIQLFGEAKNRTSWIIYNSSTTLNIYWANNRTNGGVQSGFQIPYLGSFDVKIPEDDPSKEVWVWAASGAPAIYVYEGFGDKK